MEPLLIALLIVLVLMVGRVPIAMAFAWVCIFLVIWFDVDPITLISGGYHTMKSVIILAVPLFILVGTLMEISGLSVRLVAVVDSIVGRIKGGLGVATVVTCALFGAIGGTCSAAVAAVGTIMIPRMVDHGYPRGYATALVSCSSILGQLIPPSVPMILFALVSGQSVLGCWLATVGPGIVMVIIYSAMNLLMVRKFRLRLEPRLGFVEQMKKIGASLRYGSISLILPFVILGGVYGGVFTPVESASVAVIYIMIAGFALRAFTVRGVLEKGLVPSVATTGAVLIILFFVLMFVRVMVMEEIPQHLIAWLETLSLNKYMLLGVVNVLLLVMGMLMDDGSGSLLAGTLIMPVMISAGVHPLHFAAITGVNLGLGNITPPVAPILYLGGRIGNCKLEEYIKPALTLMYVGMLPVLAITTFWPALALFLPRMAGFAE